MKNEDGKPTRGPNRIPTVNEEKRNKECLFKVEKTKNEEIDELLAAQYDLEDENGKLKTQANQTQKLVDTLNADKSKLEERLAQEV